MGRYFLYRKHLFSLGKLVRQEVGLKTVQPPQRMDTPAFLDLLRFGGYLEPFLRADTRLYNRWRRTRTELLFREDLRDLTRIQEAGQVEVLGRLLADRAGQMINYSDLAADERTLSRPTSSRPWTGGPTLAWETLLSITSVTRRSAT